MLPVRLKSFLRHPASFAIIATLSLVAALALAAPLTLAKFETLSPQRKVTELEALSYRDGILLLDGDTPEIILSGARDPDPQVQLAALEALENLIITLRFLTDFGDHFIPDLSPAFTENIDALVLAGISQPEDVNFQAYLWIAQDIMTEGDFYHAATMEALIRTGDDTIKTRIWYTLCEALGPRYEAADYVLEVLQADAPEQARARAATLARYLLDERFIEPLATIAIDTQLSHNLRHAALSALADYGAAAQDYLPLLRSLPDAPTGMTTAAPTPLAKYTPSRKAPPLTPSKQNSQTAPHPATSTPSGNKLRQLDPSWKCPQDISKLGGNVREPPTTHTAGALKDASKLGSNARKPRAGIQQGHLRTGKQHKKAASDAHSRGAEGRFQIGRQRKRVATGVQQGH